MFKIATSQTYFFPVAVELPGDNGKTSKVTFDAEFRRLTQTQLEDFTGRVKDGSLTDDAFVREVLVGWKGVQDEDGNDLPFSEGNRDMLMDIYPVRSSVIKAFFESISGARAKN